MYIKKYRRWIIMASIVFAIAVYFGMQGKGSQKNNEDVHYEFSTARVGDIDIIVSGVGQVQSSQYVELKAVAAGDAIDVTAVHVVNNEEVSEGQLLVSLDDREAARHVYDAQIALESEQIKQKQVNELYDAQTVDDKYQRQLVELSVKDKASELVQAQENLSDYQIRAPFDGVVTDFAVSSGDSISRTDVIASLIAGDNTVTVTLNEVDALRVEAGDQTTLTFDALPGTELSGAVSRVDTIGVAQQGVVGYDIEIAFDSSNDSQEVEDLRPGMSTNAEITAQSTESVLIVPNSAIKGFGEEIYVEQLVDGSITKMPVEIGISNTFHTQILSGLNEGDEVITNTMTVNKQEERDDSPSLLGGTRIPGGGR